MRMIRSAGAILALPLLLAGCGVPGGGATLSGTLAAGYFGITSDVTIVLESDTTTLTLPVPLAGWTNQEGTFVFANIPAGTYAVTLGFEDDDGYVVGTTYRLDGGEWTAVDEETVTATPPYAFSIVIDSLEVGAATVMDVYFGDAE
jgi:hypothetical protein